jgi:hypothetical protein
MGGGAWGACVEPGGAVLGGRPRETGGWLADHHRMSQQAPYHHSRSSTTTPHVTPAWCAVLQVLKVYVNHSQLTGCGCYKEEHN